MIEEFNNKDISQVAKIHQTELTGFLSELGIEFLEKFYKATLSIPEIFTLVEKENDQVLGFVTCSTTARGLYKKIIYTDIMSFFFLFLKYFVTHPKNIVKTIRLLTYPGFADEGPELLVIAVDMSHQRKGIGGKLFRRIVREFEKLNINEFKISVYDKLSANRFYEKIGCRKIQTFSFLSEKMNYYLYSQKNKLRIILLDFDSLYANPVFLPLLGNNSFEVAAIIRSGCIIPKKSALFSLLFFFKTHGPKYFLFKAIDQMIYLIFSQKRVLDIAARRKIPVIKVNDINSPESVQILKSFYPDFIISYFNQILKKDVLNLCKCINVHPGFLPLYRGVASSFWAMQRGGRFGGVSVHLMEEKLDCGDILRQGKVPIKNRESLHAHNYRCCLLGGKLLLEALLDLTCSKSNLIKQREGEYYSWPREADVELFLKKGFRLWKLEDWKLYFYKYHL